MVTPSDSPSFSKENQHHSPEASLGDDQNLRSTAINKVFWSLFEQCPPIEGKEEIIVTGHVKYDGMGDWFAMLNMCKHLKKKFPERSICLIASSSSNWKGKLKAENVDELHLAYDTNEENFNEPEEKAQILTKAKAAGVIVTGVVSKRKLFSTILDDIQHKSIQILEYDTDSSLSNKFGDTTIPMGLTRAGEGMWEELPSGLGIFISSHKGVCTWKDIQNAHLKQLVFSSNDIDDQTIQDYAAKRECFLCYIREQEKQGYFIRDAVICANAKDPEKHVDIVMPGGRKFSSEDYRHMHKAMKLEEFNVGTVKWVWMEGAVQKEQSQTIGSGAKEVRIIVPGLLSRKDFKALMRVSAPLVGCTGDSSIAQALSFGKIPFYEFGTHKMPLYSAILKRSKDLGKDSSFFKYIKGLYAPQEPEAIQMRAVALADPRIMEEAVAFSQTIREEANVTPLLKGVVNERLYRQKDPSFAKEEDTIRDNFLNSKITLQQATEQFKELLKAKKLLGKEEGGA